MSESAVQVIARGDRAPAEAAAAAIDANPLLENATYSILEEDEDKEIWRIDEATLAPSGRVISASPPAASLSGSAPVRS